MPKTTPATKAASRLYPMVRPVRYAIELKPDLKRFTFAGRMSLELMLERASKTVTLHAKELKIGHVRVVGSQTAQAKISRNEKEETPYGLKECGT